jgi:DNA-binding NarL/FixJ family response regulator
MDALCPHCPISTAWSRSPALACDRAALACDRAALAYDRAFEACCTVIRLWRPAQRREAKPAGALVTGGDAAGSSQDVTVLTPRELDVLTLVAQGLSNPEIARRLVLSEHTVHRHLANILRKLGLSSRAAAAAWGVRTGLV